MFRLREFDENGAVIGEKESSGGEQIAHNAVAYDSETGTLYVLWRELVSSFLQTYRLRPEEGSFERLQRLAVLRWKKFIISRSSQGQITSVRGPTTAA